MPGEQNYALCAGGAAPRARRALRTAWRYSSWRLRGSLPSFRRPRHRRRESPDYAVRVPLVGAPAGGVGSRDAVSDLETRSEGTLRVDAKPQSGATQALNGQAPQCLKHSGFLQF